MNGVFNTTATVTDSLAEGMVRASMDDQHEVQRRRIQESQAGTGAGGSIAAGFAGLGHGLWGGVTSLVKETYTGTAKNGATGFVTGLGKGIVGTVTKPAAGVLDLATGTSKAISGANRSSVNEGSSNRNSIQRQQTLDPGELPSYNMQQGMGVQQPVPMNRMNSEVINASQYSSNRTRSLSMRQESLDATAIAAAYNPRQQQQVDLIDLGEMPVYNFDHGRALQTQRSQNDKKAEEIVISYEVVREDLSLLISSEKIVIFTVHPNGMKTANRKISFGDLVNCSVIPPNYPADTRAFVELVVTTEGIVDRPRIRCNTENVAKRVSQQITFAKGIFEEKKYMLGRVPNAEY